MKKIIEIFAEVDSRNSFKTVEPLQVDDSGACCGSSSKETDNAGNSGGGCGCSGGSTNIKISIDEVMDKYGEFYDIHIVNPNQVDKGDFIKKLNHVLKSSGERLEVKESTYEFALSKILPMIAVEDKIISVNTVPSADEIHEAVETGVRIKAKKGCC